MEAMVTSPSHEMHANQPSLPGGHESTYGDGDTATKNAKIYKKVPKILLNRLQMGESRAKHVNSEVSEMEAFRALDLMLRDEARRENKVVRKGTGTRRSTHNYICGSSPRDEKG